MVSPGMQRLQALASSLRPEHWLAVIAGLSLFLRAWLSFRYFGFLTGDDVEILQAGFERALDLDYSPWDIRNTLISDVLVAPILWLARHAGVESVRVLCWLATWSFVGLSVLNIRLLYGVVERWVGDSAVALVSAGVYSLHWLPLGFGSTVYPRTASTACVLGAAFLLSSRSASNKNYVGAGLLSSIAFAFRYSEIIFLAPLLLVVALGRSELKRRLQSITLLLASAGAGSVVFIGLYDLFVWGRPFASLIAFWDYTLVKRQASSLVAMQPFHFYLWRLPHWISPAALPFLYVAIRRRLLHPALPFVLIPLFTLSMIHHKDLRYLQGVIPFISALTAVGVVTLWRKGWRRLTVGLIVLSLAWTTVHMRFLTRKSMAAVLAAESISATSDVGIFAGQQLWAYGDRLYFSNAVELRDIPYPGDVESLSKAARGADYVALYDETLNKNPGFDNVLRSIGQCHAMSFSSGRSKSVSVFKPCEN